MRRAAKTVSYWLVHITVAVSLTYLLTGNWKAAMAVGLLEPTVQAFVFYIHDWLWERKPNREKQAEYLEGQGALA